MKIKTLSVYFFKCSFIRRVSSVIFELDEVSISNFVQFRFQGMTLKIERVKLLQMAGNDSKLLEMALNGSTQFQIAPNGSKWLQMTQNSPKYLQIAPIGTKWLYIDSNGYKWL